MRTAKAKPAAQKWTAQAVLRKLEQGKFAKPAHVVLEEVRNRTGYAGVERYADALVVSTWPSRGLWLAGVEVKVSRSDWLTELRKPDKSAEIQRFCNYWWVAVPEGIVSQSELPLTWGLIEVSPKGCKVAKEAPRLEPEPLSIGFLASILRHVEKRQDRIKQLGRAEVLKQFEDRETRLRENEDAAYERQAAERQATEDIRHEHTKCATELDHVRATVRAYEQHTGIPSSELQRLRRYHSADVDYSERTAAAYQLARRMLDPNAREYVEGLGRRANELSEILSGFVERSKAESEWRSE